ncbi:thymidine kinase [Alkaliphilus sp. MSJ-5]|uniref:Thymidine kinase n=1 Tax=Alkaliphilus flagellatus TaxID=2841507 RepID=A0ABS6G5B6_9FIRM|nr:MULTISPECIES: thymidine kinase [Alkaliphilus]MBU5676561.1 thymidine kinase [Alkaliphilus flagellatus]QUH19126.1 thymidine kinase [Alkaliphilus sp. B6464]
MMDFIEYSKNGSIEMIVGPMYAGKSEELIRRVNRSKIANLKVLSFKPAIDSRYSTEHITSHNGKQLECISVTSASEVLKYIESEEFDVLAIDEVQFLGEDIVDICQKAANMGKRVICSGLDMDFRGEPFQVVPSLMAIAEYITKLTAVCMKCKMPATRTQRIVNGQPAKYDDPIIMVGAKESYEARCRACHEVIK